MALLAANGLQGTDGVQPTLTTLGQTGNAPVDLVNAGLEYDNAQLIRGRNTLRMRTLYIRNDSGRFAYLLPSSGPWTVRFFVRPLPLTDPYDISDYRYLMRLGNQVLVMRESSARNVVTRLQDHTNLSAAPQQGTETGSAVVFNQVIRYEVTYDGTTLTCRVYPGNSTTSFRQNAWTVSLAGVDRFTLSSYRLYRYATLQQGNTDANTSGRVTPFQQRLLIWNPNSLPQFGADGDYGTETTNAVSAYQAEVGLPANGIASMETQTALDLTVRLASNPNDYPVPFWIGNLAVTDTGVPIGPLDPHTSSTETGVMAFAGQAEAEESTVAAHGFMALGATLEVTADHRDTLQDTIGLEGDLLVSTSKTAGVGGAIGFEGSVSILGQSFIPEPPKSPPQAELQIYSPDGSLRGTLPYPLSWSASVPLSDVGTMDLVVAADAPGTHLLTHPFEVALRLRSADAEEFVEPPGCRFISLRRQRNWSDRTTTYRWTLANYGWQLRKARLRTGTVPLPTRVERKFTNQRAGAILLILAQESSRRFGGFARNFTATQDTNGVNWTDRQTLTYDVGVDYYTIATGFSDEGVLNWRFNQRTWEAFRGDLPIQTATSVVIPAERNVLEANEIISYEDYANYVMFLASAIHPDNPEIRRRVVSSRGGGVGLTGWGQWEDLLAIPGAEDLVTAGVEAEARLAITDRIPIQTDRRLQVVADEPVPLLDYSAGSRVTVEDATQRDYDMPADRTTLSPWTTRQSIVQQITMTYGQERALEAIVTLDDMFRTRASKQSKRLNALMGSANFIGGSRSTVPF